MRTRETVVTLVRRIVSCVGVAVLAACGSTPPPPDWEVDAHAALDAYARDALRGRTALADRDLGEVDAVSSTGRPGLVARVQLTRCAIERAALAFDACPDPVATGRDGGAEERAPTRSSCRATGRGSRRVICRKPTAPSSQRRTTARASLRCAASTTVCRVSSPAGRSWARHACRRTGWTSRSMPRPKADSGGRCWRGWGLAKEPRHWPATRSPSAGSARASQWRAEHRPPDSTDLRDGDRCRPGGRVRNVQWIAATGMIPARRV